MAPRPLRNLGLALILGLLLGIGLAVVRELLDNSITSSEDLATITSAPVLGHIGTDATSVKEPPGAAATWTCR